MFMPQAALSVEQLTVLTELLAHTQNDSRDLAFPGMVWFWLCQEKILHGCLTNCQQRRVKDFPLPRKELLQKSRKLWDTWAVPNPDDFQDIHHPLSFPFLAGQLADAQTFSHVTIPIYQADLFIHR